MAFYTAEIQAYADRMAKTPIGTLSYAARQVRLKWKSGSLDKAGIIDRLCQNRSMAQAAVAVIAHVEAGTYRPGTNQESPPNPHAVSEWDSVIDDAVSEVAPEPISQPKAPESVLPAIPLAVDPTPSVDSGALQGVLASLQGVHSALQSLSQGQIQLTRAEQTLGENLQSLARKTETTIQGLHSNINGLVSRVKTLEERKPIVFESGGKRLPAISGQHQSFNRFFALCQMQPQTRLHVLLIGPASSGKTSAAIKYAELIGKELFSQPLSLSVADVLGFVGPNGNRVETEFTRAWISGSPFLWDEISMSMPDAVGALNAALANGFASIPGLGNIPMTPGFLCIAGDNSDTGANQEYGARSLLDGATLDRFVRLDWQIDPMIEASLAGEYTSWLACVRAIRAEIQKREIAHVGATMRAVIAGANLLASNFYRDGLFTRQTILEDTCRKGALVAEWANILRLPAVSQFLQGA